MKSHTYDQMILNVFKHDLVIFKHRKRNRVSNRYLSPTDSLPLNRDEAKSMEKSGFPTRVARAQGLEPASSASQGEYEKGGVLKVELGLDPRTLIRNIKPYKVFLKYSAT